MNDHFDVCVCSKCTTRRMQSELATLRAQLSASEERRKELREALESQSFAADGWANSFYNALQHIKNLRDGISSFDDVLANLADCEKQSQSDWAKANAKARAALANDAEQKGGDANG